MCTSHVRILPFICRGVGWGGCTRALGSHSLGRDRFAAGRRLVRCNSKVSAYLRPYNVCPGFFQRASPLGGLMFFKFIRTEQVLVCLTGLSRSKLFISFEDRSGRPMARTKSDFRHLVHPMLDCVSKICVIHRFVQASHDERRRESAYGLDMTKKALVAVYLCRPQKLRQLRILLSSTHYSRARSYQMASA